jgi:hypothetical protein
MPMRKRTAWSLGIPGILGFFCLSLFLGTLSCNSGTGSRTSTTSTGGGGQGVGWTISVRTTTNTVSISQSQTTSVIVQVKDSAGGPAPKGTRICISIARGTIWVDEIGKDEPVITGCANTTNDIGQLMGTYVPNRGNTAENPFTPGHDYIDASSQGVFGSAVINVVP